MSISPQPATHPRGIGPRGLETRGGTLVRIVGLVAATAFGCALVAAITLALGLWALYGVR